MNRAAYNKEQFHHHNSSQLFEKKRRIRDHSHTVSVYKNYSILPIDVQS